MLSHRSRPASPARNLLWAALVVAPLSAPAAHGGTTDEGHATLAIRAERVIVRPGHVLEHATVLVIDGKIAQVGTDVQVPEGARVVEGQVCCAGFLDTWSTIGLTSRGADDERTDANTRTVDAFDPFDEHARARALRAGVVAARIQAGEDADIGGLGAVVSMAPGTDAARLVLLPDADVAATLGRTRRNRPADVFDRIGQVDKLVGEVHDGLDYGQDLRKYEQELAEWNAAIAEKEAQLEKDFKKAQKDRDKDIKEAEEKGKEHKEKSYKEDKPPSPPKFDAEKATFSRVANGLVPLVVETHRTAELRELLVATRDYDRLRLVIAGATEAEGLADQLAQRRIPVLVWPAPLGETRPDELDGFDLGLAGRLADAGVTVLLGSGGTDQGVDLPLLAQLAVGHGLDREQAFAALTYEAARAFDVADQLGSVARGRRGDLLVLDGEPLAAGTRLRYVVCDGQVLDLAANE